MILNEDFFNNVEIKDDDLTVEQPVEEYNEKTSRELLEHKISESEMILEIYITDNFHGQYNIWHRIEHILKRLKYMFDIYNINLSEPFITYERVYQEMLEDKTFPDDYTIIQHKGCNLYFPEDELREYEPDKILDKKELKLFVFLDKKIPVFKTARSAYNFVNNLNKCIWKDVTDFNGECFNWYGLYKRNDFDYDVNVIGDSCIFYINNYADNMFDSIIKIVSEEVGNQLMKKKKVLQIPHYEQLKKMDLENIIKMMNQ